MAARWAHNPKVGGSSPPPATNEIIVLNSLYPRIQAILFVKILNKIIYYTYIYNAQECIDVHFERPTKNEFDSVRIKLPTYEVTVWEGNYSDEEIEFF